MKYYSTSNRSARVGFREATIKGQPDGGGLFFPATIPKHPEEFYQSINHLSKEEIAFDVLRPYTTGDLPAPELGRMVKDTFNFDFPLAGITDSISVLELFHGPTLAFKDVGARFMSLCLGYFAANENRKTTVLVATSGDTGGAVGRAFHKVEGVEVIILYPKGKVSPVQEFQLTTLEHNVSAIAIEGTFDDCQQLVKRAFSDEDLSNKIHLTSANSINVARWLPQQVYYFFAWQQWKHKHEPPVIAVPSGNFGNICAGLLAYRSGLPVSHFIAACNTNDVVPEFFKSGKYTAKKAVTTISNAMDVGDPSNFIRLLELTGNHSERLKNIISAVSISDSITKTTIRQLEHDYHYLADPHGAVGFHALEKYLQEHPGKKGFFLETAHPVKFPEVVESVTGKKIVVPASVEAILQKKKHYTKMKADFGELKEFLIRR